MLLFLFFIYVIGFSILFLMTCKHHKRMQRQQQKIHDILVELLHEMNGFRVRQETLLKAATVHTTMRENVFLDIIAKLQSRVNKIEKRIER